MNRFIILSFLVMGWAYWELSGGAQFQPQSWPTVDDAEIAAPASDGTTGGGDPLAGVGIVTRADTSALSTFDIDGTVTPSSTDAAITAALEDVLGQPQPDIDPVEIAAEPVPGPDIAPDVAPDVASDPVVASRDLREVTGERVNMRDGPGTDFGVIEQLVRGTVITVIEDAGNGWVRVRVDASGRAGWMAADFLLPMNG
ncbi:MAG: SH3 domain-containing protein [Rubellimicrobium sp.]|nr:SH3 domain-containing protein [Rubellimicrobium sp.]